MGVLQNVANLSHLYIIIIWMFMKSKHPIYWPTYRQWMQWSTHAIAVARCACTVIMFWRLWANRFGAIMARHSSRAKTVWNFRSVLTWFFFFGLRKIRSLMRVTGHSRKISHEESDVERRRCLDAPTPLFSPCRYGTLSKSDVFIHFFYKQTP